jgi:hypothetical protein
MNTKFLRQHTIYNHCQKQMQKPPVPMITMYHFRKIHNNPVYILLAILVPMFMMSVFILSDFFNNIRSMTRRKVQAMFATPMTANDFTVNS